MSASGGGTENLPPDILRQAVERLPMPEAMNAASHPREARASSSARRRSAPGGTLSG